MMLPVPAYILNAHVVDPHIRYLWDEWHVNDYFLWLDEPLFNRLDALSDAANLALAIGCGEWIEHRFSKVNTDPHPGYYLAAAWAAIVHPRYCSYVENSDDLWRGPVRGPLNIMMGILNDGIHCRETDDHEATRACWMYNLTKHVLEQGATTFDRWFENCVQRLEKDHPWVEDDDIWEDGPPFGFPVPREALDPDFPYAAQMAPDLIDRFLQSCDPVVNPYLAPPGVLTADLTFKGTVYRYRADDWIEM